MRTAPEGWYHEPADHSVGIFGELLLHQCGTEDEAVEVGTDQSTADGVVTYVTTYRCPACGAEIQATEAWPDLPEEEESYV